MLQLNAQHRAGKRVEEPPVLHEEFHHGHEIGQLLNLIDEYKRFARDKGHVGYEPDAGNEVLGIRCLGKVPFGCPILVEVDGHHGFELGASELIDQIALSDLASTRYKKSRFAAMGLPLLQYFESFSLKHDVILHMPL